MKKQYKMIALLLVLALVLSSIIGCSDKSENKDTVKQSENPKKVDRKGINLTAEETDLEGTFTYWSTFTGDSAVWEQWRVDFFNELYADQGIKCEVQFVTDAAGIKNGKLLSAIAGKTAPDLIISDDPTAAYSYAANGSFEAMDEHLQTVGINVNEFFDGCKDVIYYDEKAYLVPQDANVIMLYYNPKIAKEAGLDPEKPPKTLEELDAWADAMTVKKDDNTYERFGLIPWLDSGDDAWTLPFFFGCDVYNTETKTLDMTSDNMVKYLEWVDSYAQKYDPEKIQAFTSGLGGMFSPDHAFMTGKVGMTITGNWFTNALKIYAPDLEYKVCAVPAPEYGRSNSTTFGVNVFAIPSGAKNPELAAFFIKFCLAGAINEDNFSAWRSIPTSDKEFDSVSWTKNGDPIYALQRQLANSPDAGIPALCAVASELANSFRTLRESVIYTDADIKTELQKIQDKYTEELKAYK